MNRRNVLVGLGTIVAGGGAALGTGAFSSVEADREMTIQTTGDGSALLALSATTSEFSGVSNNGTGDVLALQFSDLNADAVTTFNGLLTISNNGSNEVDLDVSTNEDVTFLYDPDGSGGRDTALSGNTATIGVDGDMTFDVEIDLQGQNSVDATQTITFTATDTSA
ncbi:hypothetical protein NDI89_04900 [Natrinema sp. S1CR25-10]|uniref:DUF1102 domain-containing protein n=2 Tax=Natrinema salsiterrestre TaxID=2950540 RepID=A0A9Q4KZ89_9EURY|nr:hypothetical protein [Natrinema salsiterrestre]